MHQEQYQHKSIASQIFLKKITYMFRKTNQFTIITEVIGLQLG